MTTVEILERIRDYLELEIRSGTTSERHLAHLAGLSQPHVHHILSRRRTLTPSTADRLLSALGARLRDVLADTRRPPA